MAVQIFSEMVLTPQDAIDLVGVAKGNGELKKQMMKTFQKANRRIQNVRNAGLSSPAVQQLISERGERGYTFFSGARLDPRNPTEWEQLKYEYGRAIAFLNNPTSSATGARQYIAKAMPECLKKAIPAGIGLFIAFIGFQNVGIIQDNPYTLTQFVDIHGAINGEAGLEFIFCSKTSSIWKKPTSELMFTSMRIGFS